MKSQLNRRDFLKLAGLLPLSLAPRVFQKLDGRSSTQQTPGNVIVIVFDAFSANNISMHGYGRATTPNLARLAKRAVVYHNHYAAGNYTTPGTASLLTGVLPWTHRAIQPNKEVDETFASRSLFRALPNHYSIAYTHNKWANTLLKQFQHDIDELIATEKLLLGSYDTTIHQLFKNDDDVSSVSWARNMKVNEEGHAYSLFLSHLYEELQKKKIRNIMPLFPRGLPTSGSDNGFTIEQAVDYITDRMTTISRPFIGYFHFLPPHHPYRTSKEFYDAFKGDGFNPVEKPTDIFARKISKDLPTKREWYDESILYCDREFGRLYNILENSGILDNTWLVLTSDHGEMFERGMSGHMNDALYQPVIRIPLMIFEPGRETGMDIHQRTSAIDVLPTLAHLAGGKFPDWTEGVILPPFSSAQQIPDRNLYVVRATEVEMHDPLTIASIAQISGNYKLHYYYGYPETPGDGVVRLFDIESDPEEMVDLAATKRETASELLNELKTSLKQADEPYLK